MSCWASSAELFGECWSRGWMIHASTKFCSRPAGKWIPDQRCSVRCRTPILGSPLFLSFGANICLMNFFFCCSSQRYYIQEIVPPPLACYLFKSSLSVQPLLKPFSCTSNAATYFLSLSFFSTSTLPSYGPVCWWEMYSVAPGVRRGDAFGPLDVSPLKY